MSIVKNFSNFSLNNKTQEMKKILLLCAFLAMHLFAFSQSGYTVYNHDMPINDYALIDLKYDPAAILIVNNYSKEYEHITLVSFETNDGDVYFNEADEFPIEIAGGQGQYLTIYSTYECNTSSEVALLTLTITNYASVTTTFHIYVKTIDYVDITAPTFTYCPSNITVSTQPGKSYGYLLYTVPTATDNCGGVTLKLVSGGFNGSISFPGMNIIRYRATDMAGNYSDCSFYVIVEDNEPPDLTCPPENSRMVETDQNGTAALPDYTSLICVDDNAQQGTSAVTQTPEPGTIIDETTLVTIQAVDYSDNISECDFEVTLKDVLAPVIENPGDQTIELQEDCYAALPDYTAGIVITDNHDPSVQIMQYPPSGTEISAPVYVTVAAVDDAGNRSETGFNVNVTDNINPEITCPDDQIISVLNTELPYTVQCREFDPVFAWDNCTYSLENDYNSEATLEGETFDTGIGTTIYWTITDGEGNTAGCSFDVSFDVITGTNVLKENDVSVFPNPTNGSFTVYTSEDYSVNIFDTKGIMVLSQPVRPGYNTLDLSQYSAGYYIIVFTNDRENFSIKICKEPK